MGRKVEGVREYLKKLCGRPGFSAAGALGRVIRCPPSLLTNVEKKVNARRSCEVSEFTLGSFHDKSTNGLDLAASEINNLFCNARIGNVDEK